MRFDEPTRARFRRDIMKRGQVLADILADILAGKDRDRSLDALIVGKPGLRPEERARMALDQVMSRRKLLDDGDDAFGRCDVCGADLGLPALGEMPWADRCIAHTHD